MDRILEYFNQTLDLIGGVIRVLDPPRVLGPPSVQGTGSSEGPGSCFSGVPYAIYYLELLSI